MGNMLLLEPFWLLRLMIQPPPQSHSPCTGREKKHVQQKPPGQHPGHGRPCHQRAAKPSGQKCEPRPPRKAPSPARQAKGLQANRKGFQASRKGLQASRKGIQASFTGPQASPYRGPCRKTDSTHREDMLLCAASLGRLTRPLPKANLAAQV